MGGQVQLMAKSTPQVASCVKSGKLRALAVTSRARNPALPDVPTMIEAGIKGFEVVGSYGVPAPSGAPRPVLAKLSAVFKAALDAPEIRSRRVQQGANTACPGSDHFGRSLTAEMRRRAKAVKHASARLD